MIVVNRFSRLRAPGVFHDFKWPTDLPEFGRYNLIYGWNGTGKTSLSKILRALELRTDLSTGQAVLRIQGTDVKGEAFASRTMPIRVFNRDFVNESVFRSAGGLMPPIFVVGKESAEKQKEVDRLTEQHHIAAVCLEDLSSKKKEAEKDLAKFCITAAKQIKDTLRSSDPSPYNDYDKAQFRKRAEEMVVHGDRASHELKDADKAILRKQIQATPKMTLSGLTYEMPALASVAANVSKLLGSTVLSSTIGALKVDHELSEWTRTGLHLHNAAGGDHCLFCTQRLPAGRLPELEAHFNTEYENFIKRLDSQIDELQSAAEEAAELKWPNKAELHEKFATEYEKAEQALLDARRIACDFFKALIEETGKKKERPFESLESVVSVPSFDCDPVDALNSVISKHNDECRNLESRVGTAQDQCALDMIATDLEEFVCLEKAEKQAGLDVTRAEAEVALITDEISRLGQEISGKRRPAEELNKDLANYLGHDELQLDIRETGYAISRGDEPAEALSEGETTAIALLYFLKSLEDTHFALSESAVVLDDPVSSLDANALYLAFGLIQERTKDSGQLFIFTHTVTFFRHVRHWFNYLKGKGGEDPARFYMLDRTSAGARRSSAIVQLDPLLERYESDYHYLFSRICRAAYAGSAEGFEQNYFLPNMARRVLEAFLAFRQPDVSGDLWRKLEDTDFDEAKRKRIIRFVHTYSHGDTLGEPQHDPSILGETRSVLNDLLDFMESQDPSHFAAMKKIAKLPGPEEESE